MSEPGSLGRMLGSLMSGERQKVNIWRDMGKISEFWLGLFKKKIKVKRFWDNFNKGNLKGFLNV